MKRRKVKRVLKYTLIVILILLIITIWPSLFYKAEKNDNPMPAYYKKGVYHLHSVFSDGTGDLRKITGAASSRNLDFVILTDHGRPNIPCVKATAYYDHVLLIGGSEFSLNCGHLAAAGFSIPGYIFPPEPQEAINDVIADKGVCFISHPYDRIAWTDWDVKDFTGIEVLSAASCAGKLSIFQFLAFLARYPFNHNYALLKTLHYPEKNIAKWNEINRRGKYYGIYALDAHAKLPVTKKIRFHFPSYKAMFEILTVYVKVDEEFSQEAGHAESSIILSLKKGHFFNVIEAIAPANGFEASFTGEDGNIIEMGDSSDAEAGVIKITLPFTFATDILVKRNGGLYKKIPGNTKKEVNLEVNQPGVYYIEVYVAKNSFKKLPWILTNPFFLNVKYPGEPQNLEEDEIELKKLLVDRKNFFKAEPNSSSEGTLSYDVGKADELITKLKFHLQKEPGKEDFWSCLAHRENFDFSGFAGMVFEAKSNERLRFWVELRTTGSEGEKWYSHSFLCGREWKRIHIPFDRFHLVYGLREKPEISKINSIFFTINNGIAYPGTEGALELKSIGLY
ncbi:MAG: CIA30 family protein [Candidatus Aminicenantes bacterium]|nr:CIA30 family protein [Candidatus Aminicenantes bacterium]